MVTEITPGVLRLTLGIFDPTRPDPADWLPNEFGLPVDGQVDSDNQIIRLRETLETYAPAGGYAVITRRDISAWGEAINTALALQIRAKRRAGNGLITRTIFNNLLRNNDEADQQAVLQGEQDAQLQGSFKVSTFETVSLIMRVPFKDDRDGTNVKWPIRTITPVAIGGKLQRTIDCSPQTLRNIADIAILAFQLGSAPDGARRIDVVQPIDIPTP